MKVYNDTFVEELIRRSRGTGETIFKAGAVFLTVLLTIAAFIFVGLFFPFFLAVFCILLFFAFKYTIKEYEYSFINGDFDIDVIHGMRKRKRILSISCKEIRIMARAEAETVMSDSFNQVLDASISANTPDRWYIICDKQDGERLLLYINPSARMKEAFKKYLGVRMKGE